MKILLLESRKPMTLLIRIVLIVLAGRFLCWAQFGGIQQPMFAPAATGTELSEIMATNNVIMWLKSDALVTNELGVSPPLNNGNVNHWGDSWTNHFNLHSPNNPVYLSSGGPNSYPAISWTNASDGARLTNTGPLYAQPNTFVMVVYSGTTNTTRTNPNFFDSQTTTNRETASLTSRTVESYSGSVISGAGFITNIWQIVTWCFNGGSSYMRTNGVSFATGDAGTQGCAGFTLGGYQTGLSLYTFNGRFAEVFWFNVNLSAGNLDIVEQYLADKYAIPIP